MTSSPPSAPVSGPVWVVVVAGGSGTRFGALKQYEPLAGRRVLDWSLDAARSGSAGVVLVVPSEQLGKPEPQADVVVAGGTTRSGSVRAGLAAVPDDAAVVLVHDAARPLASPALFDAVIGAVAAGADAAVPAVAVADTLRRLDGAAVDRSELVAVQTPQGFRAEALRAVHEAEPEATDDASLIEAAGGCVVVVPGEARNRKITDPDDLRMAEALLRTGGS
jgi:2-C-methyl-D-erythritol 4-phosphate cytidylyltransferase